MDKMIGLSDLVTGDVLQRLRGHAGPVQDICFDATKILSGSADCTLRSAEGERSSFPPPLPVSN